MRIFILEAEDKLLTLGEIFNCKYILPSADRASCRTVLKVPKALAGCAIISKAVTYPTTLPGDSSPKDTL